ncbi:immunoglobulin superfamily member 1-like [Gracilinanus agilis]|uniref:immunoglobulin superfamily member 1-like n=1 Tax=Gracilinanus agilis TaxID=191870 RepID=UPI001CFF0EB8|nr:immunoglobulin superfamily member 1-like [Gracilinanus agilis]
MNPTVTFLFSIGLCLDGVIRAQMGTLIRPALSAVPSRLVYYGGNVTLRCQGQEGSDRFQLWKDGELIEERNATWDLAQFMLKNVDEMIEEGSYSCRYRRGTSWSEPSKPLFLVLDGLLPKPALWALPGPVVAPGTNVTLWCSRPKLSSVKERTFILWKDGMWKPLEKQLSAESRTGFLLSSVSPKDTGNYSCTYRERSASTRGSKTSDALELLVPDAFPKASLSVWPGPEVASGTNVTLLCHGPTWSTGFLLYKEGDDKILQGTDIIQDGAQFFLTHVTPKHSGIYTCTYQPSTNGSLWTQHSDPLELIVRVSSRILIITFSFISILLLCVVLLTFLCHPTSSMGAFLGDSPRRCLCCSCLPQTVSPSHHLEASREETLYAEVAERARERMRDKSYTELKPQLKNFSQKWDITRSQLWEIIPLWDEKPKSLVSLDTVPRPTFWAVPSPVVAQGADVTLLCQGQLGSERFQLWKDGELREERNVSQHLAQFMFRNVDVLRDARSYSCRYGQGALWSEFSDPLALVVTGQLPKPTLWAQPGLVVAAGTKITFWCSRPKLSSLEKVTFTLWRNRTQKPLQQQTSADPWTSFLFPSVRPQDTGSYSCTYKETVRSARDSEPSDVLELLVSDALPKPSLSARPGPEVVSGANVTLLCQGATWKTRYVLHKERGEEILPSLDITQEGAQFFLTHVTPKHSGNYSCSYKLSINDSLWTKSSDPLELIVRGKRSTSRSLPLQPLQGNATKALALVKRERRRDNRNFDSWPQFQGQEEQGCKLGPDSLRHMCGTQ